MLQYIYFYGILTLIDWYRACCVCFVLITVMAPKDKSIAKKVGEKRRKTTGQSSRSGSFDAARFKGAAQYARYKELQKRAITPERIFDISQSGNFGRFPEIIENRGWETLINPPSRLNYDLVREFYANAIPIEDEAVSFKTWVRGVNIRFDRDAINNYLGKPSTLPSDELCEFSKHVARGNWDVPGLLQDVLREGASIEYSKNGDAPLRALRDDIQKFHQLLFLLVTCNILPKSHTSDAPIRMLTLIHYMDQDREVDVARVISQEMKNMVLSGIRPTPLKTSCNLAFPGLIMGLLTEARVTIPPHVDHFVATINDVHANRYCKYKKILVAPNQAGGQSSAPSAAPVPPAASNYTDPNFPVFYNYICDQNDAGYRAMSAIHESIFNLQQQQPMMTPPEFVNHVNWPWDRPNFSGGGGAGGDANAEGDDDIDMTAADAFVDEGDDDNGAGNDDDM
jgi:hypothetical protein